MTARSAEINIHLRARKQDKAIIDQAASLVGANRSQFMLSSAISAAKAILLEQTTLYADAKSFQEIMDWMDGEASPAEADGIRRLLGTKASWSA